MNEIKQAVESAREAQKRALAELDDQITNAREHAHLGRFTDDDEEIEALDKLTRLLQARSWWRKSLT